MTQYMDRVLLCQHVQGQPPSQRAVPSTLGALGTDISCYGD